MRDLDGCHPLDTRRGIARNHRGDDVLAIRHATSVMRPRDLRPLPQEDASGSLKSVIRGMHARWARGATWCPS